jgi:hypothetical protein|tara:strand:+ start:6505 stop:7971 length:1467 start_codon:yes stop_codon:yes gene_type:complete
MALDCNNITSLKRNLSPGATLLLGDQIVDGDAIFQGGESSTTGVSEEELLQNQAAAEVYDIELTTTSAFNTGDTLGAGDYITEEGFIAGPNGIEVIHSGYGGDARIFAEGTSLDVGDIVVNGKVIDPDGNILDAPVSIDREGYKIGEGGGIVTPGGADSDDAYCSLQELAGKPQKGDRLDDLAAKLDFDVNIPGLSGDWWVKIQKKINALTMMQGKFLSKTQNLITLMEMEPDKACDLIPDVNKLVKIMNKVLKTISKINKILKKINKTIKKIKKVVKLILKLIKPLRVVQAILFMIQMIEGIPIMIDAAVKNMTMTQKVLPQLIALLQKIVAQCAMNRGAEAGLSKEQCEKLGGVYVDRALGDLGDAGSLDGAPGLPDPNADLDNLLDDLNEGDDGDNLYFPPNMGLNPGDTLIDGIALGDGGETLQAPATVPATGNWVMGEDGGAGVSENGILSEEEIDAILDSQILDLSECMTELDDMLKTTSYR